MSTYVKLANPLDHNLTLQYKGQVYEIEAKSSREFPADVAAKWMEIYGFINKSQAAKDEPTPEKVKEAAEEKPKKVVKK